MKRYAARDTITGTVYPQPNKLIAEKVAQWHGHCEVIELPEDDSEWEYSVTSKWGPLTCARLSTAKGHAQQLRESIAQGRESGDLKYHGRILRRRPASQPGSWEPVPEEVPHD